jgi:hypothetical protein
MKVARRLAAVLLMALGLVIPSLVSKPVEAASNEVRVFIRTSVHPDWIRVYPSASGSTRIPDNLIPLFWTQRTQPFIAVAVQRDKPFALPSLSTPPNFGGSVRATTSPAPWGSEGQYSGNGITFNHPLPNLHLATQYTVFSPNGTYQGPAHATAFYATNRRYLLHEGTLAFNVSGTCTGCGSYVIEFKSTEGGCNRCPA